MKRGFVLVTMVAILLSACATAHKISKVNIGLSKQEVIELMGQPVSTSAQGNVEYLNYALYETDDDAFMGWTKRYYVRIINGRVESFGRTGDFDSTKTPTVRIETDKRIDVTSLSDIVDVLVEGIDDGLKSNKQQDREEAILNAKLQAVERAGINISSITTIENFALKKDWIENKAEAILMPGFQLIDKGYQEDGTYLVIISGKIKPTNIKAKQINTN